MNKNQYKVIFNKKCGQMVVVAENTLNKSYSAADTKVNVRTEFNDEQSTHVFQQIRTLTFSVMLATGMANFAYAQAIHVDKSAPQTQQPAIHQSANGTPQVNIQTPSKAGVSVNQYTQFDVGNKGAILNNSRTNVQTQIGGWVQSNPWLTSSEAKIIVNQVNSNNPSQLNGYIEVAGRRAEVVMANPSGISVNGGGFINAAGVTLTTGLPVMNNGVLSGFQVRSGQVNIDGQGLDTAGSDFTRILTQAAKINAGIWANDLKIVAGTNNIDANGNHTAVTDNTVADLPVVAIDTANLGGMYAGKITLVSSDKGVGVNNAGQIYAGAGGVTIDVNGHLINGNSIVASDEKQKNEQAASVHLTADTLSNNGHISGQGNSTISAMNINNQGTIFSGNTLTIQNQAATDNHGSILADGNVNLQSQSLTNPGTLAAGNDITVHLADSFTVDTDIQAGHDLYLETDGDVINTHTLQAGSSVDIHAAHIDNQVNAAIQANTTARLNAQYIDNRGLINSNDQTLLHADQQMNNVGTGKIYGNHIAVEAATAVNQEEMIGETATSATIAARERLDLAAKDIYNREHAVLSSENTLVVGGVLDTDYHAVNSAAMLDNASAKILSGGDMTLNTDSFTNHNLHFKSSVKEVPGSRKNLTAYVPDGGSWYESSHVTGSGDHGAIYLDGREYERYTRFTYVRYEKKDYVDESDPALLQAKGSMALNGTALTNDKSQILANSITMRLNEINNIDAEGSHVVIQSGTSRHHYVGWNKHKTHHKSKWNSTVPYKPADIVTPIKLNVMQYDTQNTSAVNTVNTEVRTVTPSLHLPDQSMFGINKKNDHQPVIETDPAFASYRQWLGSDYMLKELGQNPDNMQQRLGDGYYEQRLVNEQIAQLTGKVRLDGYTSNEQQYKALMDSGVTASKELHLTPGIALSGDQVSRLTSDIVWLVQQDVTLPDGTVTKVLVPQVYVVARQGDLNGDGSLIAADEIKMNISGDVNNNGTIAGRKIVDLAAQNINNLGGVIQGADVKANAAHDINNMGGQFVAEHSLTLDAAHNINSETTTHKTENKVGQSDFTAENIERLAGLYVTAKDGVLVASAGNNLHLTATDISSAGSVTLQANNDVNLDTVTTGKKDHGYGSANNQIMSGATTEVGSRIQANGDVTIQSGNNTHIRAADVNSQSGATRLLAGKDIVVEDGRATMDSALSTQEKNKGMLSKSETIRHYNSHSDTTVSANITGEQVLMKAGQDIQIKGSNVVSDNQTVLSAQRNIEIAAAEDKNKSTKEVIKKKSGLMSSGGIGFSIGSQKDNVNTDDANISHTGSGVGSLHGDITMVSGGQYQQTGSRVSSPEGSTTIVAKEVNIEAAKDSYSNDYKHSFEKKGLTVAINVPVVNVIQTAVTATERVGQSNNARVNAMAAANSVYDSVNAAKNIQSALDNPSAASQNISASITYGQQKTEDRSHTEGTRATASKINAGNEVNILASGAGEQSNINIIGSDVSGQGGTTLMADNAVNLMAAEQGNSERSKNTSSGWNAGLAISYGSNGFAFGVTAGGNAGKGHGNGDDVTYRNTHVGDANSQTTIQSSGTTNIKGATVTGKGVDIAAAELNIESLQNTSKYDSKQQNISGQVTVGYGFSGSANYSQSKMNADYAAVNEQAGIMTGDDGYQINVAGNTDLKGAIMTSTQTAEDAGKNSLTTGSLTYSDLKNHADYKGSSFGIAGSADIKGGWNGQTVDKNNAATNSLTNDIGFGFDKGHDKSITQSGINTSNITIKNDVQQEQLTGRNAEQTIADIHTDATTDNYKDQAGYLANNFDKNKVQKELDVQLAVTQEFSKNVQSAQKEINAKIDKLKDNLDKNLVSQSEYDEEVKNLQYLSLGLSTVASGLAAPTSSVGGIIAATASPSIAYAIGQHFKEENAEGSVNHILAHAVLGAAVASAGGNNALTAAIAAGGAEAISPVVANWLYGTHQSDELTSDQKAVVSAIASLAGTGVGAATGNVADMVSDGQLAQNAVDNNYLTKEQAKFLHNSLSAIDAVSTVCKNIDCQAERDAILKEYRELSKKQDAELAQMCASNPGSEACVGKAKDALEYTGGVNGDIEFARKEMADQFASSKNILNILYNNQDGQNLTSNVVDTIDNRANFFGTNSDYYRELGIPVKWFGGAEDVSRRIWTGLGADGEASYVTFSVGTIFLKSDLYNWRDEAGNALIQTGFENFKNLYNGRYQSPMDWDINQLKSEQKVLQPIHEKYLKNAHKFVKVITFTSDDMNILDYKSRVKYGCNLMGYSASQGCKP